MYLQRKYVDLIRDTTSKWVNWDPPIPVRVGAYGEVELETGDLRVEGNIYDKEFQEELKALKIPIDMSQSPPEEGGAEDDMIIASSGAKRVAVNLGPQVGLAGVANVSIQGQWEFEHGKRDALLIMHCPRIRFVPSKVPIETLFKVPKLKGKWLVTVIHICPAFSMYLSNKTGEKVSLALTGQVPLAVAPGIGVGGEVGLSWWSDSQTELFRRAADRLGRYCFTPLYTMKKRMGLRQRLFRQGEEQTTEEELWDEGTPWDPLDEDGEEDALDMGDKRDNDNF